MNTADGEKMEEREREVIKSTVENYQTRDEEMHREFTKSIDRIDMRD